MAYTKHGRVTSQVVATPTQVVSYSLPVSKVLFQALRSNTGFVVIGGRNVRASSGEQNGVSLAVPATSTPQMQEFTNVNLMDLYIDVTVANEGVAYVYE